MRLENRGGNIGSELGGLICATQGAYGDGYQKNGGANGSGTFCI